jgi:hypothetical protein
MQYGRVGSKVLGMNTFWAFTITVVVVIAAAVL